MSAVNAKCRRGMRAYIRFFLSGFCMGCADIVPGVSGGTMAFILGIYEELVYSIRAFGRIEFVQVLMTARIRRIWKEMNLAFLLSVGAGILVAIATLAHSIEFALTAYPTYVWSFFFGLVLASVLIVGRRIARWNTPLLMALIIGAVSAYIIVGLVPVETPETWWFLIFSGAVAICAMILPGVSGSFLLVLLGKYEFILRAVNERDVGSILLVAIGAGAGIIGFTQVLGWLLRRYHDVTMAVLTGLMLGSLRRIWPWKVTTNGAELLQQNRLPVFLENGTLQAEAVMPIVLMVAGIVVIILLERLANTKGQCRRV
ncbi:MAG: DUF368 domain-containing protein [Candidatus Peribacteraceae bacterium]|nr:DUF368 domain-containing protein [Candidatus Peribacteraceae bacterium]